MAHASWVGFPNVYFSHGHIPIWLFTISAGVHDRARCIVYTGDYPRAGSELLSWSIGGKDPSSS
jgi:hypothetical protein